MQGSDDDIGKFPNSCKTGEYRLSNNRTHLWVRKEALYNIPPPPPNKNVLNKRTDSAIKDTILLQVRISDIVFLKKIGCR